MFNVVIPARMHSTRLPKKMLMDICGLPLIIRVAKQALLSKANKVVVATDHQEIYDECIKHNISVVMTSDKHESGTDRIAEVAEKLNLSSDEIVINVQGDEPLIEPDLINQLADFIINKKTSIATIAHEINSYSDVANPNFVKVVLDKNNKALYFSRAMIPFYRDGYANQEMPTKLNVLRHVGIYAYEVSFLRAYSSLVSCPLEQTESLEQLRAMYNGYDISVMCANNVPATGVDTIEDLEKVREIIKAQ